MTQPSPIVTSAKYDLSTEWTWGQHEGKLTPGLFGIMYFVQVTLEKKLAPFKVLEITNKRVHIEWLQPDIRPGQQEEPMMRGSYCLYSQRGPLKQKQRKKKESDPAEQASTGAKTGAKVAAGESALGTLGRRPNYPMRVQILRRKRKEGPLQRQSNHRKTCRLREKVHAQKQNSIMQEWMVTAKKTRLQTMNGPAHRVTVTTVNLLNQKEKFRNRSNGEDLLGLRSTRAMVLRINRDQQKLGVASRHRQKPHKSKGATQGRIPKEIMRTVGMHPASNIRRKVISGKETYQLVEDDFVDDPSAENNIMSQRGLPADTNFESALESNNYMQGHNTVQVGSAATGMTQPAEPRPSKHGAAMSAPGNLAKNANLTRRKRIKARFSMKKGAKLGSKK
eukprot:g28260.t1